MRVKVSISTLESKVMTTTVINIPDNLNETQILDILEKAFGSKAEVFYDLVEEDKPISNEQIKEG